MKQLTKFEWIGVGAALAIIVYFFVTGSINMPLTNSEINTTTNNMIEDTNGATTNNEQSGDSIKSEDLGGVVVEDQIIGTGEVAENGKTVAVHYTGAFADGTVFDSSVSRGEPIEFRLGEGMVISGWEKGLVGMKVGGKRKLIISPEAGYGVDGVRHPQTGQVIIPGNAILIFDVELVNVQ